MSEGHPDKVCDRISDEVVDLFFREGAKAGLDPCDIRVGCETLATTNRVVVAGEVRGPAVNSGAIEAAVRDAVKDIGYEQDGFHWRNLDVSVLLHAQSVDIARGVDSVTSKLRASRQNKSGARASSDCMRKARASAISFRSSGSSQPAATEASTTKAVSNGDLRDATPKSLPASPFRGCRRRVRGSSLR